MISIICIRVAAIVIVNSLLYLYNYSYFWGEVIFLMFTLPLIILFILEKSHLLFLFANIYYNALQKITIKKFIIIMICVFLVDLTFFDMLLALLPTSLTFYLFEIEMEPKKCSGKNMFCKKTLYHGNIFLDQQSRRYIFIESNKDNLRKLGLKKTSPANHPMYQPGPKAEFDSFWLILSSCPPRGVSKEDCFISDMKVKGSNAEQGEQYAYKTIYISKKAAKKLGFMVIGTQEAANLEKEGSESRAKLDKAYYDPRFLSKQDITKAQT
jgi:hypothetical protein